MTSISYPHALLLVAVSAGILAAVPGTFQAVHATDVVQLDTRTVGIIIPYDWAHSQNIHDVIEIAVYDFNRGAEERGWLLDAVVKPEGGIDASKTAINLIREFESDGIDIILAPLDDAGLLSVSDYVNQNGILAISYLPSFADLSSPNDYIFRLAPDVDSYVDASIALLQNDGITSVVMITADAGRQFESGIATAINRTDGMELAGSIRVPTDPVPSDYLQVVKTLEGVLASSGSDNPYDGGSKTAVLLYEGMDGSESKGVILRAAATAAFNGHDAPWYGPGHYLDDLDGNSAAVAFLQDANYKSIKPAIDENRVNVCIDARAGYMGLSDADSIASYSVYDAILVLGNAIDLSGEASATADAVRDNMVAASKQFDAAGSATGISLDSNGDIAAGDYLVYEVNPAGDIHGKVDRLFVATARYDSASGEIVAQPVYGKMMRIGSLASETGSLANLGHGAGHSICLAVSDYNAQLRADGSDWQLELVTLDDGTVPSRSLENIMEFHDNGIRAVLGPVSSGSVTAVKPFADENDMLVISYSSSSPLLKYDDDYIFRIRASDDNTVSAYMKMLEHDRITDVIVVYRDDVWGKALYDKMEESLLLVAAAGGEPRLLLGIPYDVDSSHADLEYVSDRIGDLVSANDNGRTAVVLFGFQELAALFDRAKHDISLQDNLWYGYTSPLIGDGTSARQAWMENVRFLTLDPVHAPNDLSRTIDGLGYGVSIYSYYAYDATFILAGAIKESNLSLDGAELASHVPAVAKSLYAPAVGFPIELDAAGDLAGTDYSASVFRDGSYVEYAYYDISRNELLLAGDSPKRTCR